MGGALIVILLLPFYTTSKIRSGYFRPYYKILYWFLIGIFLLLGWIGAKPPEAPYTIIGQVATLLYFMIFLVFIPLLEWVEAKLYFFIKK